MMENRLARIVEKQSQRSKNIITMPKSNHDGSSSSSYFNFRSQYIILFLVMPFELGFLLLTKSSKSSKRYMEDLIYKNKNASILVTDICGQHPNKYNRLCFGIIKEGTPQLNSKFWPYLHAQRVSLIKSKLKVFSRNYFLIIFQV